MDDGAVSLPRVVWDGSPLKDARRTAGIGRYIASLLAAMEDLEGSPPLVALPRRSPHSETWIWRRVNAEPALGAAIVRRRPRLVHCLASDPTFVWPASRQVVTVHDVAAWTTHLPPRNTPTWRYLRVQQKRIRRCAGVIAISDGVAADVTDLIRVPPSRVHVVPQGVDAIFQPDGTERDAELRRSAGIAEPEYVLWVGSLRAWDPRKALDVLFDAMASLHARPVPLVLVGDGDAGVGPAARATEAGVQVRTPGFVSDETLAALYRGATVVVLPSHHEGFGLTALEALACGSPLVAAAAGNLLRLVGDAAVVVPPANASALASGIRSLLDDPDLRLRLRAAGPPVAARYTWRRTAELTAEVYIKSAGRRPVADR